MTSPALLQTDRTRLRRLHEKGSYERDTIHGILDAMPLAHIGYVIDGTPSVLPTLQWREGDHVYWHGSSASRALRAMKAQQICMTVTILDGYVLARSAMHHSVNQRSVMVFGTPEQITDSDAKSIHLKAMFDHVFPDRWQTLRPMHPQEVKATAVFRMSITEASAKLRDAQPGDDEEDYDLPIWAGVVPISQQLGAPVSDPRNHDSVLVPAHLGRIRIG